MDWRCTFQLQLMMLAPKVSRPGLLSRPHAVILQHTISGDTLCTSTVFRGHNGCEQNNYHKLL